MKFYFLLQYKRFHRKLSEMGIHPYLGMLLLLAVFILASFFLFQKTEYAAYIYAFMGLSYLGSFSDKLKTDFLKQCYSRSKYFQLRLMENVLMTFPFFIFLIIYQELIISLSMLLISVILAFIPLQNKWSITIPTPFSRYPFEFAMGFRKLILLYPAILFLVYKSIEVGNFNLGIFAIGVLVILQMSYYFKPENKYYVWIYSDSPQQFLWKKVKESLVYSSLSLLPILIFMGIWFPDQYLILLGILFMNALLMTTIILAKYSAFPNEMSLPQWLLFGLSIWFPPILIIAIIYFYKQSYKNLKPLLQ